MLNISSYKFNIKEALSTYRGVRCVTNVTRRCCRWQTRAKHCIMANALKIKVDARCVTNLRSN